jgi:hypothetical protein
MCTTREIQGIARHSQMATTAPEQRYRNPYVRASSSNAPAQRYSNQYARGSVQRGSMAIRRAESQVRHSYPPTLVDYRRIPRQRQLSHMNQPVYEDEYVQVHPPRRRSQAFARVPAFEQIAEDFEEIPEYLPQNNIACAKSDDNDQYDYDWESDAVYFFLLIDCRVTLLDLHGNMCYFRQVFESHRQLLDDWRRLSTVLVVFPCLPQNTLIL